MRNLFIFLIFNFFIAMPAFAQESGKSLYDAAMKAANENNVSIAENAGVKPLLLADIDAKMYGSFDVVVEASGSESGFATALDLVRPCGKIVVKSTFHGTPAWAASRVVVDEITIVGSRCGRFTPALDLLTNGSVDVTPLISDEFSFADDVAAMDRAAENGVLKVLLRP